MTRQRDPYATVGAATRLAWSRLLEGAPPGAAAYKVMGAITVMTSSWSLLEETVPRAELARLTRLDPRDVTRALKTLAELGAIEYTPGTSHPGQKRVASRVRLPAPLYSDGISPTGDTQHPRSSSVSPVTHSAPTGDTQHPRPVTRATTLNEKCSEDSLEGAAPVVVDALRRLAIGELEDEKRAGFKPRSEPAVIASKVTRLAQTHRVALSGVAAETGITDAAELLLEVDRRSSRRRAVDVARSIGRTFAATDQADVDVVGALRERFDDVDLLRSALDGGREVRPSIPAEYP